jgi:hypothetical protein
MLASLMPGMPEAPVAAQPFDEDYTTWIETLSIALCPDLRKGRGSG